MDCYKHCSNNVQSFLKFYVGDSRTFNDASNTLCGDVAFENNTLSKGTILCDRAATAAYVHIVGANNASSRCRFKELKAFTEVEIGRSIA